MHVKGSMKCAVIAILSMVSPGCGALGVVRVGAGSELRTVPITDAISYADHSYLDTLTGTTSTINYGIHLDTTNRIEPRDLSGLNNRMELHFAEPVFWDEAAISGGTRTKSEPEISTILQTQTYDVSRSDSEGIVVIDIPAFPANSWATSCVKGLRAKKPSGEMESLAESCFTFGRLMGDVNGDAVVYYNSWSNHDPYDDFDLFGPHWTQMMPGTDDLPFVPRFDVDRDGRVSNGDLNAIISGFAAGDEIKTLPFPDMHNLVPTSP